ncbi:MAG: S-methyl-5-thioribose-1-phosphate isomerase [Caldisericales bacterium]|nr:S-methyl-5-thioribose-1-phosphate isomerase [Caldisericales bacterium]
MEEESAFSREELSWLLAQSKVPRPLIFDEGALKILDQRILPGKIVYIDANSWEEVALAIKSMMVRGAPMIGIAGAYGMALAATKDPGNIERAAIELKKTRPTAINLSWAVDRVLRIAMENPEGAISEAREIEAEDHERSFLIAKNGSSLIKPGMRVLTHCNSGSLAAGGFGTALGCIIWAKLIDGKEISVFNTETRPYLQGSRLTSFELASADVPDTLIPDMAASLLLSKRMVDLVIVGADRVARNGDVANKVGTLQLAISAHHYGIPFYVASPRTTFDMSIESGKEIPIEERPAEELVIFNGIKMAPDGISVFNPAFDVAPFNLVTGYITESGVIGAWKIPYLD